MYSKEGRGRGFYNKPCIFYQIFAAELCYGRGGEGLNFLQNGVT